MDEYAVKQSMAAQGAYQHLQNQAQAYAGDAEPPRLRPLEQMRRVSYEHAQNIRDMTMTLTQLADQLLGPEPQPLNPPGGIMGGATSQTQAEPPMVAGAEQAQFMVGEALESLRRAVHRLMAL